MRLALLTAVFICACLLAPVALGAAGEARSAGIVAVNDTGRLRFTSERASQLVEEGPATGNLPGTVRARLQLSATTARIGFTIYLHNGTITGHAVAKLNAGRGEYSSFAGALAVSHGSGHYAHSSGTGRLSGTINRNTDAAIVQVVGQLHI